MPRKHKKVLRKNITLIMCALIGTIVVVYGVGMILFRGYVKEIANIASRTFDFYGNELDQKMNGINTQLVNTLLNNKSIREIEEMDLNTEDNSVVYSIAEQNELKQYFQAMAIDYGDEYHFWFYNKDKDIFLITGDDEYLQKELFKGYIRTVASEEQIPITEKRKWFVQDVQGTLFLTTTFCLKNNYVGCWIRPEKICASFRKTQEDTLSFFIRDLSTGVHYLENSSASGSMFQKNENIQENSSSHYWEYEFENANVSIGIDVSDKIKKSAGTYEILMAITTVLICFMCIGAFYYFRHYVQKPLYIFEENLRKYQETGELEQNNYYEEFENVGEIWRNLEKEIQELKVQVYEEQLEKQKTKIDYLQLQIRPHFYINCLNSIYSMAQLKHTEEIQQLALYVSGYMRSIFRKGTKPILMDEELQQIVNYVKIHNILYRYDCKCHICVDERVKQAMIPPLIMIVFVENCVKYTVGSKRKIEISIEGSFLDEEQKKIQIRIADNGPGFPENVLEKFRKNEFGANDDRFQIGIRNTKDRLQLLYGAEASLMIGNGENLGTEVIIIIPYQNGDEKSEYSISR